MLVKKVTDYAYYRCHDVLEHAHYLQMFAVNKEVIDYFISSITFSVILIRTGYFF